MIDIGFIGLGTMGRPMARHLLAAGHRLYLHDVATVAPELKAEGARTLGLSLPSTAVAQQLFSACAAHGGRSWDHSALVRALEMMAGHEIAAA